MDRGRPKLPPKRPKRTINLFIGGSRQVFMGIGKPKSTLAPRVSGWDNGFRKWISFLRPVGRNKYDKPHQGKQECARRIRQGLESKKPIYIPSQRHQDDKP